MGNGLLLLALALAGPPVDESNASGPYRTSNFEVEAPTREIARRIGREAERLRKDRARLWLGEELPDWSRRCPIKVKINARALNGATTFGYFKGKILSQKMEIEGPLPRLLESVLPHEVTHMILAQHFRCPVPRWADEGAAVLSETDADRQRHEQMARQILNTPGRAMPLRRLFDLTEYPRDVMALFAEGYSVTRFLVTAKDRKTFLAFVEEGKSQNWDRAVRAHYGYASVEKLEEAWVKDLRNDWASHAAANARGPRPEGSTRPERESRPRTTATEAEPQRAGQPSHSRSARPTR